MEYIEEIQEQVILVGVQLDENDNVKESLDELEELADTAGAQTVGKIIQNRETVHPGTYIGKGKIEEVRALMLATDATGIICDDELSPAQMNNLEHELECKVMDRTLLILDILQNMPPQVRVRSGRAGQPPLQSIQTGRTRCVFVQTWRRNRNPRSWREESWRATDV